MLENYGALLHYIQYIMCILVSIVHVYTLCIQVGTYTIPFLAMYAPPRQAEFVVEMYTGALNTSARI